MGFIDLNFDNGADGTTLESYTPGAGETAGFTASRQTVGGIWGATSVISDADRLRAGSIGSTGSVYVLSPSPPGNDYSVDFDAHCFTNDGSAPTVWLRTSVTFAFNGYALTHQKFQGWRVVKWDGGGNSVLGTPLAEMSDGSDIRLRFEVVGTTLNVYEWVASAWTLRGTYTDSTHASGPAGIGFGSFGTAGNATGIHFDNVSFSGPAVPVLAVTGPGGAITDGGTLDLGILDTGSSQSRTLTLSNPGGATLNLGTITASGVTLTTDPSSTAVAIGDDTDLIFSVPTGSPGAISASLAIPSDDAASPFDITITGSVVTPTIPTAPSNLSANASSSTSIQLNWIDNSNNETGFKVDWSANGSSGWAALATTAANATGYLDTTVPASTTRFYRVRATNGAGDSSNTSAASATTPAAGSPLAPNAVVATAVDDTVVNLTWEVPAGPAETSLTVKRQDGVGGTSRAIATLSAYERLYQDRALYSGATYLYSVAATNANGTSTSAPVSVTMPTSPVQGVSLMADLTGLAVAVVDAWTTTVSWDDPNGTSRFYVIERSTDGEATYRPIAMGQGTDHVSYTDAYLLPGTTYRYRVLVRGYNARSRYTPSVSATTTARTGGRPLEPTITTIEEIGATQVRITIDDPNGSSTTYRVERAPLDAFAVNPFVEVGTFTGGGSPGAVVFDDFTATARGAFAYRIRAQNGSGLSGYTKSGAVFTPPNDPSWDRTFAIGPGKTYTSIAAFSPSNGGPGWDSLAPGDTVYLFPNRDGSSNVIPYFERLMLTVRGTPTRPIRIIGVPDPATGQRPILDGTNATTSPEFTVTYTPYDQGYGIFIASHTTNGPGHPGWLTIENLEIRNFYQGDSKTNLYTGFDGVQRHYGGANGFYLHWCDHVTIRNCYLHDNGQGLFGKSYGDPIRYIADLTLENNRLANNGCYQSYLEHNSYMEGYRTVYHANKYETLRAGAGGNSGLKDRGVGTKILNNSFSGSAHYNDLVEPQDLEPGGILDPAGLGVDIAGNIYFSDADATRGQAASFIHYGGDQYNPPSERRGVVRFWNNTVVQKGQTYKIPLFNSTNPIGAMDARNNIFYSTGSSPVSEPDLTSTVGFVRYGANWVTSTWQPSFAGYGAFTGTAIGTSHIVNNGGTNDPGFVNFAAKDLRLATGAHASAKSDPIPSSWPALTTSYRDVARESPRADLADLGAEPLQATGDSTAPTVTARSVPTAGTTITLTTSEAVEPVFSAEGFALAGTTTAGIRSWTSSGTTLTLNLWGTVYQTDTVTLSYSSTVGGVSDPSKNLLATFSGAAITNGSTQVPDVTAPTVPTGLAATPGLRRVDLTWTASTDAGGVAAYNVRRNGTRILTVAHPTTSAADTNIPGGVSNAYTVSAVDRQGNESAPCAAVNATAVPDIPGAPGTPTAGTVQATYSLDWGDVARATSYQVFRDDILIATTSQSSYTETAILGSYRYSVKAVGPDGASAGGPEVTVTSSGGGGGGGRGGVSIVGGSIIA